MPSFHAGQRVPASLLNALTTLSVPNLTSGTISGDTETALSTTLAIPAAPIDRIVKPELALIVSQSNASDRYMFRIRSGSAAGPIRAQFNRSPPGSTATWSVTVPGPGYLLPAGDTDTLVVTITRLAGSGSAELGASSSGNMLTAMMSTAP